MTPSFLLRIFRRHGPLLTTRAWAFIGGSVAAAVLVFTFLIRWT